MIARQKLHVLILALVLALVIFGDGFSERSVARAENSVASISRGVEIESVSNVSEKAPTATVYRDPNCSCCEGWIKHLRSNGFRVSEIERPDMTVVKREYNVPEKLTSCHTAIVEGAVVEGHVPAGDIKRFLSEKSGALGIAAPGMPVGSPGMEIGGKREAFTVFSFDRRGKATTFERHPS
jgi:hypothetical protein